MLGDRPVRPPDLESPVRWVDSLRDCAGIDVMTLDTRTPRSIVDDG